MSEQTRKALAWAGVLAGLFVLWFGIGLLPDGRRAPIGVLMSSLYIGGLTALTAVALVLVYRSVRIINFAQIALGGVGAIIFFSLVRRQWVPWGIAFPAGLLVGVIVGLVIGVVMVTLFYRHPRLVLTVTTIVIAGVIAQNEGFLASAFQEEEDLSREISIPPPFPAVKLLISGIQFNLGHLIGFLFIVGTLVGLAIFFRKTRFGVAVRASAENADRASLLGINVKVVQMVVWGIAGFLSVVQLMSQIPLTGYTTGAGTDPTLLLQPMAAAVVARMTNLPIAVGASIAMGLLDGIVKWAYPNTGYLDIGLLIVILGALLTQKSKLIARQVEASSWKAITEIRSTPRELDRLRFIRYTRRGVLLLVAAFALAWPWLFDAGRTQTAGFALINGIIALSLLILTGWTGQISLGQYALVAVGAVFGGILTGKLGWPFWVAIPVAAALGAGFAYLVGIPALRIRGLFLAVTTFVLALVVPAMLFTDEMFGRFHPDEVRRPKLFFIDFTNERWYYYLTLGFFALVMFMVRSLRRSRTGRILIAIRDDEAGAQAFGINVPKSRLSAFALSGALAGLAGVLLVHQQLGLEQTTYGVGASFFIYIWAIVGGLGALTGPVMGVIAFLVVGELPIPWNFILIGALPLVVLIFVPGGIAQIVFGVRDSVLRVIAMRRHIIVPSLFADYSPEAWERRLAPLAPPLPNRGLAALPAGRRYSLSSRLWGRDSLGDKVYTEPAFLQGKGK